MAQGTIENLLETQINLRSLGWLIPGLATANIPDEIKYDDIKKAQAELESRITASDITLRDTGAQVIGAGDVQGWIEDTWEVGPPGQVGAAGACSYQLTGRIDGGLYSSYAYWFMFSVPYSVGVERSFHVFKDSHLKRVVLAVDEADNGNTYVVSIYKHPHGTPELIHSEFLTLPTDTKKVISSSLNLALTAGEYGMKMQRKTGSGSSDFESVRIDFQLEVDQ